MSTLDIYAFEGFYGGSHKSWLDELTLTSQHNIKKFTLPDKSWKWRMLGGAVSFSQQLKNIDSPKPELILVTDMIDVSTFKSLLPVGWRDIPIALYFHENQMAYPWSSQDKDKKSGSDKHYHFINYISAMAADRVFFNSHFNYQSFIQGCEKLLRSYPNHQNLETLDLIREKSEVLPLGIELPSAKAYSPNTPMRIAWNHRWEYDKGPDDFFEILTKLKDSGSEFELVILGTRQQNYPKVFDLAKEKFSQEIVHIGEVASKEDYLTLLSSADVALTTSYQDFFGISVLEAIQLGCLPLLPKRLAYPEHFPPGLHHDYFFENQNEAITKLKELTQKKHSEEVGHDIQAIQRKISSYRWETMGPIYDIKFSALANELRSK